MNLKHSGKHIIGTFLAAAAITGVGGFTGSAAAAASPSPSINVQDATARSGVTGTFNAQNVDWVKKWCAPLGKYGPIMCWCQRYLGDVPPNWQDYPPRPFATDGIRNPYRPVCPTVAKI